MAAEWCDEDHRQEEEHLQAVAGRVRRRGEHREGLQPVQPRRLSEFLPPKTARIPRDSWNENISSVSERFG